MLWGEKAGSPLNFPRFSKQGSQIKFSSKITNEVSKRDKLHKQDSQWVLKQGSEAGSTSKVPRSGFQGRFQQVSASCFQQKLYM